MDKSTFDAVLSGLQEAFRHHTNHPDDNVELDVELFVELEDN